MKSSLLAGLLALSGILFATIPGCQSEVAETKHEDSVKEAPANVSKTSPFAPPGVIEPSTAVSMPPTGANPEPAKPADAKPADAKAEPPK